MLWYPAEDRITFGDHGSTEFGDNQITDITDAAIRELVQFEDFCFDPNPIPEDRLEQINAYIKGLND